VEADLVPVRDDVIAIGLLAHDAVLAAWRRSAVGVVPSITPETFGLVALEAMSAGVPVVASRVGGLPDVVADGETGILVADRRPEAFAAAIATLLDDAALRERMGEAARIRAATFTWDRAVHRMAAIYARVTRPDVVTATPCGYSDNEVMAVAG
jgi:glycosyltransferase involved in cell wall biosynthesis